MAVKIGSGPDAWAIWHTYHPDQVPWERFLDEVVEAGYQWIESGVYGYLPTDPPTLRAELDRRGLNMTATTIHTGRLEDPGDWPRLERAVVRAGEFAAAMDMKHIVLIGESYVERWTKKQVAPKELDETGWRRLIETTHKVAEMTVSRFGVPIAFHPHVESHVETPEQTEAFLEQTDADLVSICHDVGHHAYRGGDSVGFYRKHHGRISYLHLKTMDAAKLARVNAEAIPYETAVEMGTFCEPAEGIVDFAALGEALSDLDYDGWATVEHDSLMPPSDTLLPLGKRTRTYLREVGVG